MATPADWQPGDDVIVPTAGSCGVAKDRVEGKAGEMTCHDWFFCTKKLAKEEVLCEGSEELVFGPRRPPAHRQVSEEPAPTWSGLSALVR